MYIRASYGGRGDCALSYMRKIQRRIVNALSGFDGRGDRTFTMRFSGCDTFVLMDHANGRNV